MTIYRAPIAFHSLKASLLQQLLFYRSTPATPFWFMPDKKKKQQKQPASTPEPSQSQDCESITTTKHVSKALHDGHPLPKLFVFDLDYTLWPLWVDTHVSTPLKYIKTNCVADRHGEQFSMYPDVPDLLYELHGMNVKIGAASRTHTPDIARDMLKLLALENSTTGDKTTKKAIEFFDEMQIFPGNKVQHFTALHNKTKIDYSDMIFFDDESRNRNVEKELGVVFVWVRDGVSADAFDKGIDAWRKRWGKTRPTKEEKSLSDKAREL